MQQPRIPINSCEGMLQKLEWEHGRLQAEWNEYQSFNFIVTAYHLYADWFDRAGSTPQRQRKNRLPPSGQKLFFVLRDITNASKHFKLDATGEAKRVVGDVSAPKIADWDAYFNTGPMIYISVDQASLSMARLASLTLETMQWIVDGVASAFPNALLTKLDAAFQPL